MSPAPAPGAPGFQAIRFQGRALDIEYRIIPAARPDAEWLVFLHEGLGSLSMWKDWPERLCAAVQCRGLVYSRAGYGASTPRAPGERWPVEFMHRQADEALPALLERGGGAMIYTSSGAASGGSAWQVAYPMTKNSIHALARHVASRWGKQGIRANVICPGVVLTEAVKEHMTEEQVQQSHRRVPHPRLGKPDDIAAAVAFLASEDGEWVNGQVWHVNGGMQMRD